MFLSLSIFLGHSTRQFASGRVTYFILWAYTGTSVSHCQHRNKSGEVWKKNAGEWTGRVKISKEEIPGSKRSMYGYILTYPGFNGRTFKLCVLTRWDFNFCIRSSPLRGQPLCVSSISIYLWIYHWSNFLLSFIEQQWLCLMRYILVDLSEKHFVQQSIATFGTQATLFFLNRHRYTHPFATVWSGLCRSTAENNGGFVCVRVWLLVGLCTSFGYRIDGKCLTFRRVTFFTNYSHNGSVCAEKIYSWGPFHDK